MAIANSVSNDFLSMFFDNIHIFDCPLSGVEVDLNLDCFQKRVFTQFEKALHVVHSCLDKHKFSV